MGTSYRAPDERWRYRLVLGCGFVLLFARQLPAQQSFPATQSAVSFAAGAAPLQSLPPFAGLRSDSSLLAGNTQLPPADTADMEGLSAQSLLPSPSTQFPPSGRQLTLRDRFHLYLKTYTEPSFYIPPFFGAGWGQAFDTTPEWGDGSLGFERRLASAYARDVIAHTIKAGIAATDHEDPRHHLSKVHGTWPRARYAFIYTFRSPIDGGGEMFAYSSVIGCYGAALVSNSWYPAPYATVGHALGRGTTALAMRIAVNEIREFSPDISKRFHR